ncbi:MAG: ion transporter [Lachnospiraceae bacterium]|nr:ion transporter [Lachnospiraceae bacterium]
METNDNKLLRFRKRIFDIIQIGNKSDFISRFFDIFIAVVIISNIVALFLGTFEELRDYYEFFNYVEIITVSIFIVEYLLRIWTADLLYPEKKRYKAILRFLISYDGIIDLLTILPFFYLSGFVAFRMLRVVRIFHLFRINAQYDSFNVIKSVLLEKKNQIFSSVFIILIIMLASSLGMYAAEHDAQPEVFKNAFSGVWWAVSTLLTVGYGDIYPVTILGQIMAIIIAFLGVGVVAIPTGIISAGFVEQYTRVNKSDFFSKKMAINFVTISVTKDHNWENVKVSEANIPQGLVLILIVRNGETLVPQGDTVIRFNDRLMLAAQSYVDELGVKLNEVRVDPDHAWVNKRVRELDISRLTTLISISRKHKMIIPHGNTLIKANDDILIYSKSEDDLGGSEIRL